MNVAVNQKVTLSAALSGAAVGQTVEWSSSDQSVATVDQSGVVTGVKVGSAAITAKTANGFSNAATVNVVAASQQQQATVSIQAITQGGTNSPVQLNNVQGQIDVVLNVDPGQQNVERVELVVIDSITGTEKVVASQAITATPSIAAGLEGLYLQRAQANAQAAALVAANVPQTIVLSFNTAAFNPETGAVSFTNGRKLVRARLVLGTGSSQDQVASNSIAVQFNNTDGFYVVQTPLNSIEGRNQPNSAIAANGLVWYQAGRGIQVRSVPVMYSGRTVASRTISFDGFGARTVTGAAVRVDTITLPANYVSAPANGQRVRVDAAVGADGNPITLVANGGAGVINAQIVGTNSNETIGVRLDSIRIDNAGPAIAAFTLNGARGGVFNWVNAPYRLSTGLNVAGDPGVGLVNASTAGTTTNFAAGTVAVPVAAVDIVAGPASAAVGTYTRLPVATAEIRESGLAPSDVNLTYSAVATVRDLLGNPSSQRLQTTTVDPVNTVGPTSPIGTANATFGVDTIAPSIRYADEAGAGAGNAAPNILARNADSVLKTAGPLAYVVDYIDDRAGFVGSGVTSNGFVVPAGSPQFLRLTALQNVTPRVGPGRVNCEVGLTAACNPVGAPYGTVLADRWVRGVALPIAGDETVGYFTYETTVRDMAGNVSAMVTKRSALDPALPQITGFSVPATITGGQAAQFVPTADDDLEVIDGKLTVNYAAMNIVYPFGSFTIGTRWDGTLTTPVQTIFTVPNFIDQIETTDPTTHTPVNTAATSRPASATADVRDVFGDSTGAAFTQTILASAFTQAPSSWATRTGVNAVNSFRVVRVESNQIIAEVVGPTGQSVIPFNTIQFYRNVGGNDWAALNGSYTVSGQDNGTNRIWTITFTSLEPYGTQVRALGLNTTGDALATQIFP